jgi:hypothetical protein
MGSKVLKGTILFAWLLLWFAAGQQLRAADIRVKSSSQLSSGTGRLSWWQNTIAYDKPNASGLYDVWTMGADGSNDTCLTCSAAAVAKVGSLNKGNPDWHPSGAFIAFEAQGGASLGQVADAADFPGSGWSNNLWIMDAAGQNFWQITTILAGWHQALLGPACGSNIIGGRDLGHVGVDGRRFRGLPQRRAFGTEHADAHALI